MSFAWLFAIIVGAFILFLAIYASTKLISSEQRIQDAKTGERIGILLNPLETGFESAKTVSLTFPVETRVYNRCDEEGYFGKQLIQVSQKSFGKWTETNLDVGFSNKYIFSRIPAEGKKFYLFSKPFEFPFKVGDLIYMTSSEESYCFSNAPEEIREEISNLGQENLFIDNCSESSVKICFGKEAECDIDVESQYVKKDGKQMYFVGSSLMYAAIFGDSKFYECQLKRLMQKTETLAALYRDKAMLVSRIGCNSDLNAELLVLINLANNLKSSAELPQVNSIAREIGDKNSYGRCRLW